MLSTTQEQAINKTAQFDAHQRIKDCMSAVVNMVLPMRVRAALVEASSEVGKEGDLTSEEKALHPLFGGSSSYKKRSEGLLAGSFMHSYLVVFILRVFFYSFFISQFFITVKPISSPNPSLCRLVTSMAWGNKHEKNKHTTKRDLNHLKATQPLAGSCRSSSSWLPARLRCQGAKIVPQAN